MRLCVVPAVCDPDPVMTRRVALPAVNVTVVEFARRTELREPVIIAVSAVVAEVRVPVYVPSLLFVGGGERPGRGAERYRPSACREVVPARILQMHSDL